LLAATAVAFVITEGAKLSRSPIGGTQVTKIFSPTGKSKTAAHLQFRLRTRERLTVWIEDSHGQRVSTVLAPRTARRGTKLDLVWDGFASQGLLAPDGVYRPVVKLERSHRTIVLPNPIQVDTKPPVITVPHPLYPILSPDGDGHGDVFRVHYRIDERGHAILAARGTRVEFTRTQQQAGLLVWNGKLHGRPVRPGRYLLTVSAQDIATNVSKPFRFAIAQVRYVVLARKRVVVAPGGRFAIGVSSDAPTVNWRLHGRSGIERSGTLRFRAPKATGVYFLYVSVAGHAARCAVVVA
jgi:hypothetical protein